MVDQYEKNSFFPQSPCSGSQREPQRPTCRVAVVAPAPYVAVPVFTWTGFYVGVNAGAAFRDNNRDNTCTDSFGFGFGDCFGGSGLAVQTNAGLAPVVPLTGFNALGFGFNNNAAMTPSSPAAVRSATTTSSRRARAG